MNKKNISPAKKGMNRDVHPSELKPEEYSFAINTNFQDEHGSGQVILQNEPSNLKCSGFKEGYKVIGHKYDINDDRTYFFLTNATTGCSEVGYIDNITNVSGIDQIETECGCNIQVTLETPLEESEQISYCTYNTLLSDCCPRIVTSNGCLNFSIEHPIKEGNIEIKDEKIGKVLYFTDGVNPVRYIKLDHIEGYYVDNDFCEGASKPTCLQCDKLRVFPLFDKPCIQPQVIQIGGNLKAGNYEFMIAYCNEVGDEASNYYSFTNPVSIFDKNNIILDQTVLDYQTTQSIKLSIAELDDSYDFYKIAVAYRSGLDGGVKYKQYGVYPASTKEVSVTDLNDLKDLDFQTIVNRRPSYETADGISAVNGYLFQYNLKEQREVNLQPVVSLMGAFVKWQTNIAEEDLYADGVSGAKFRGYMRDEVYPLSIKFFMEGGYESPNFIFIPRPPKASELVEMSAGDKNFQSVVEAAPVCADIDRNKTWQFENTAEFEGICTIPEGTPGYEEGTPVVETVEAICVVEEPDGTTTVVDTDPSGSISIVTSLGFIQLINNNRADIIASNPPFNTTDWNSIRAILSGAYALDTCLPSYGDHCNSGAAVNTSSFIFAIEADTIDTATTFIDPTVTPAPYLPSIGMPASCEGTMFQTEIDDPSVLVEDADYTCVGTVYKRIPGMPNTVDTSASTVVTYNGTPAPISYWFMNDIGSADADLQTTTPSTAVGAGFTTFVHTNALWFKSGFPTTGDLVLELTPQNCTSSDDNNANRLRMTVFDGSTANPVSSYNVEITNLWVTNYLVFDVADFPSGEVLIAFDSPIDNGGADCVTLQPPCGCINLYRRESQYLTEIDYTNLKFGKQMTYETDCTFITPIIKGCDAFPYAYGDFAYWESLLKYPCNPELYDSSGLQITPNDLSQLDVSDVTRFESFYAPTTSGGVYQLNADTNFMDKPIRYYKFPDNRVSPFMSIDANAPKPFAKSAIYPIGFSIDNKVINTFLDIAVNNGLISLEERSKITRYEIFRGDRRTDKSIIAKGLLFDTYRYNDLNGSSIRYPNYPLNTLGFDYFNQVLHPHNSLGNTMFTFHSPDTHFYKPTLPNEMNVEAYLYGKATLEFDEVLEYCKYVILGKKARDLATTLAVAEVTLDIITQVFDWIINATAAGTYPGVVLAVVSAVLAGISITINGLVKAGELRQKWIDTFTNLGTPYNFAYYQAAMGHYGYMVPNTLSNHTYRGLQVRGYMSAGNWEFQNEFNSTTQKVNNIDREDSVFLSVGNSYRFDYPAQYRTFDNADIGILNTVRVGYTGKGRSPKYTKNTAAPYASLKQFLPTQYGSVNSIEWVNTGYCGDLSKDNNCEAIFGGDIFISRFALKKKMPFFLSNAFRLAPFTPFQHSFYFNINPVKESEDAVGRFFLDYLINDQNSFYTSLFTFPTNDSVVELDGSDVDNNFYVKPPAKFYVFSYGFPYFLTESIFNCNYRYGKRQKFEDFYPNFRDVIENTQEINVPIKEPNTYFYNSVYSATQLRNPWRMLQPTYSRDIFDNIQNGDNRVIFSRKDASETGLIDPWLIYRALDAYDFPTSYGKLVSIDDIGSEQAIGRFTNGYTIYGAVDVLADRTQPETRLLGAGGIFTGRNINFNKTELGYAGTQHTQMVSCDFGNFWVDAKRGKVFQLEPGGKGLKEITIGLEKWFKENLPFKILQTFPDMDVDNNYKGVGISMGWDDRLKRLFLTKLDYTPNCDCLEYVPGEGVYQNVTECDDIDTTPTCPNGYEFNEITQLCERTYTESACPEGFNFDVILGTCVRLVEVCPEGYEEDEEGLCVQAVLVDKIIEGDTVVVTQAGNASHAFDTPALYSAYNADGTANVDGGSPTGFTYVDVPHAFWTGFGVVADRVGNLLAKWGAVPFGQWFGGGSFIDVPVTKTYYVGVIADDIFRFSVDGVVIVTADAYAISPQHGYLNQACFAKIHMYPIELEAGCRFVQTEGLNNLGAGLFGSIIFDNTDVEILAATSLADLNVIYSTEDIFEFIANPMPTNECPEGLTPTGDTLCDKCEGFIYADKEVEGEFAEPSCELGCEIDLEVGECSCTTTIEPGHTDTLVPVELDSDCFSPCHWTVAYSPLTQTWISYYSFTPNYYVGYHDYFQTGMNTNDDRFGLWSHFSFLSSYQVFYGDIFPFTVEYSTGSQNVNSVLHSVEYWMDVRKYYNKYDFADVVGYGFTKAVVYNAHQNSGVLNLFHKKNNDIRQDLEFPRNNVNSIDILQTEQNGKWSFNTFYNIVRRENSGLPIWRFDCSQINKVLDDRLLDYRSSYKDRLRGDYFLVRLTQDIESRFKFLFRFGSDKRNYYED